jgi:hypothetical protein
MTRIVATIALALTAPLAGATAAQSAPPVASSHVLHERVRAAVKQLPVAPHSHVSSYDRAKQFGDWITQYGECDTRAVVLIKESLKPVTKNYWCTVSKGKCESHDGEEREGDEQTARRSG